jgi:hypothetical protein
LVPECVVTLMAVPLARPNSALNALVWSLNSPRASGGRQCGNDTEQDFVIVRSIDHVVVGAFGLAVHGKAGIALGCVGQAYRIRAKGPRHQRHQSGEVAPRLAVQRQLGNFFGLDHLAEFAGIDVD